MRVAPLGCLSELLQHIAATQPGLGHTSAYGPLGGVVRPRRKERFARLIHRRVRVLGGPSARAARGGNLSLPPWCHPGWYGTSRAARVLPGLDRHSVSRCAQADAATLTGGCGVGWAQPPAQSRKGAAPLPGAAPALLGWPLTVRWLPDRNGDLVRER